MSATTISVSPQPLFFELFTATQIAEIVTSIQRASEVPLKFSYVDEGAVDWDVVSARTAPVMAATLGLIVKTLPLLAQKVEKSTEVIDLGPGNGLQARTLIDFLLTRQTHLTYSAFDVSQRMLDIALATVQQSLPGSHTTGQVLDFTQQSFRELRLTRQQGPAIVLLIGGTADNSAQPEQVMTHIAANLHPGDLLLYDALLPDPTHNFAATPTQVSQRRMRLVELLGVTENLYQTEAQENALTHLRTFSIRPRYNLELRFTHNHQSVVVRMPKDKPIILWRYQSRSLPTMKQLLRRTGFKPLHGYMTPDKSRAVVVAERT